MRILKIADLEAIAAASWYDESQLGVGEKFLHTLETTYKRIRKKPRSNPRYEMYDGPHEVRRRLLKPYSYIVFYTFDEAEPVVIAIAHTSREPLYWIDRLNSLS